MTKNFDVKKDESSNLHLLMISVGEKVDGYLLTASELNALKAKLEEYIRSLE